MLKLPLEQLDPPAKIKNLVSIFYSISSHMRSNAFSPKPCWGAFYPFHKSNCGFFFSVWASFMQILGLNWDWPVLCYANNKSRILANEICSLEGKQLWEACGSVNIIVKSSNLNIYCYLSVVSWECYLIEWRQFKGRIQRIGNVLWVCLILSLNHDICLRGFTPFAN